MGVDCVIADRPKHGTDIEHDGCGTQRSEGCSPAHQRPPGKGQPQEELRPVGKTFGEWIDGDDGQRTNSKDNGKEIELQQHDQTHDCLQDHEDFRLLAADPTRGKRA